MGANEKNAATYHGVRHDPDLNLVRAVYAGASPVPRYDERAEAFDRMFDHVRAEAKAEAWDEGFFDGRRQDAEGDDGPRFVNPYREEQ